MIKGQKYTYVITDDPIAKSLDELLERMHRPMSISWWEVWPTVMLGILYLSLITFIWYDIILHRGPCIGAYVLTFVIESLWVGIFVGMHLKVRDWWKYRQWLKHNRLKLCLEDLRENVKA